MTHASTTLSNFLRIAVQAVVLVSAYSTLGGQTDTSNSIPVRILIALLASLIAGVVMIIRFLLLPEVYASFRFRFMIPVVILEDAGPLEVLYRSLELTTDDTLTVFSVWAALGVVSFLLDALGRAGRRLYECGDVSGVQLTTTV